MSVSKLYMLCRIYMYMYIPVLKGLRASSPILVVVVKGAGIALSTQPGWALTRFCLVVGQHKARFCGEVDIVIRTGSHSCAMLGDCVLEMD